MPHEITSYQSVAEGRAQADRLRPLGIVRAPASPRVICPDPSPEQMAVLERERNRFRDYADHVKGVIHPNGVMILEWRIYKSSRPWMLRSLRRDGKAMFTANEHDGWYTTRSWTVTRGERGRKPVGKRYLPQRIVRGVLLGRLNPSEAAEYGWDH